MAEAAPRDPGLQAERTALAWTRTGMAALANGLLLLRAGLVADDRPLLALSLSVLTGAGAIVAYGLRRRHALSTAPAQPAPAAAMALIAGFTALVGFAAAAGIVAVALT